MKKAVVPKIKVNLFDNLRASDFFGYQFALCTKGLQQATSFESCREGLVGEIVELYKDTPYGREGIDKNRTRLLVGKQMDWYAGTEDEQKEFRKAIMRGLRLVHHFERIAKWSLCRLYEVEGPDFDEAIYLFKADRRWQRSPYTLSLFALLIRLGRRPEFSRFKTHTEFIEICIKLSKKKRTTSDGDLKSIDYDLQFLRPGFYMKLRPLMRHFNKIFGNRSPRCLFTKCLDSGDEYQGDGIEDFCCNNYGEDKKTTKRFMNICRKYAA